MKTTETKSGLILLIAMTLVNGSNYAINLILGRFLGPELFAEFHIVATLVLVLAFVGVAIQMTAAKVSASEHQRHFIKWLHKNVRILAFICAAVFMLSSPLLSKFFKFNSFLPFIILGCGLPAYFSLCFYRGLLQGKQKFTSFALSFVIETFVRLFATVTVLFFFSSHDYVIIALAVSFIVSFFASAYYVSRKGSYSAEDFNNSKAGLTSVLWFVAFMALYELSQIIISHSDVFIAKHFLSEFKSGQYASISLIGRMIYYGTWTFVMLLFPKVIDAKNRGEDPSPLLLIVGALICAIGIGAIVFTYFWGDFLIQLLFGSEFVESGIYLYRYALATTLFALGNVIVYYYLSLEKYLPVWLSLLFGMAQIIAIWKNHSSIEEIISVQILTMSILLLCLLSYHIYIQYVASTRHKQSSLNTNMVQ